MNKKGSEIFYFLMLVIFIILATTGVIHYSTSERYKIMDDSNTLPCYDNKGNYIEGEICYETKDISCNGKPGFLNSKECNNLSEYEVIKNG